MAAINSLLEPARPPHASFSHRRAFAVALASIAAALTVAAIGHVGLSGSSTAQAALPITLGERVLLPTVVPGLVTTGTPVAIRNATAWATAGEPLLTPTREASRLEQLGFVAGIDEHLYAGRERDGAVTSTAEQYKSAAGAAAELAYQYRQVASAAHETGAALKQYAVPGIPGARGWIARYGRSAEVSVMFAQGPFYYSLTTISPANPGGLLSHSEMLSAMQSIYLMINGCVAR